MISPQKPTPETDSRFPRIPFGKITLLGSCSALVLFLLFREVDPAGTWAKLSGMNFRLLIFAVLLASFASYILGGYKWMRILAAQGSRVPYRHILLARLGSEPIKFIVPAKGGELVRPIYLKSRFDVPLTTGIGSLALDKLFNLTGLMITFALGIGLSVSLEFAGAVAAVCILGLLLFFRMSRRFSDWFAKRDGRVAVTFSKLFAGLTLLSFREIILQVILGWAFLFTEIITGFLSLRAAGIQVDLITAMTYLPAVILMVQIPITLSGIGTREAGMMLFFLPFAGKEALLATGIAFTIVELICPVLLGIPFMPELLRRIEWKKTYRSVAGDGG